MKEASCWQEGGPKSIRDPITGSRVGVKMKNVIIIFSVNDREKSFTAAQVLIDI